jgi:UDP-N-acetylmuramoyl-L-alanyl-D-glutamate--2,6-diaminopimelate ligase
VVGVTGTNGKTSVAHMLAGVLDSLGRRSEAIGTLSGIRTTPEAPEFQRCLAAWSREGVECVVAEVSSHALAQHRVDGTRFAGVAFTNLGREHLDYHATMEEYAAAKDRLFSLTFTDKAVIVVDDQAGRLQADRATAAGLEVVEVSTDSANASVERQRVEVTWRGGRLKVPVGGWFTVANVLVVAELALLLGTEDSAVAAALATVAAVPGRFEAVEVAGGLDVVVDYAHTPGALAGLLESCRDTGPRRTILVFGCGGERDRGKRPLMGAVAEAGADLVLVTSDNPRGEPPRGVIADILSGMERQPALVEPDRRLAIRAGLAMAGPDDLVVLAGRGHETIQEVDGEQVPFADREVAIEEAYRLHHGGRAG